MNDLVCIQHREAITTTLKVAKVFNKKHKDVLRTIDNLLPELPESWRRNFAPRNYLDRGKIYPMYEMNRDGFSLLINGFTGKKAITFRVTFIDAFNHMEKTLLQQRDLSWQQQRLEGKIVRRNLTDTIQEFIQYAFNQGSSHAQKYYVNISRIIRDTIGGGQARDMVDTMHLAFTTAAEYVIQQVLEEGMNEGLHYKDIYQLVKNRVHAFSDTLSGQTSITA